jgi:hypothetical protein
MANLEDPSKPGSGGDTRPPRSALRSAALVIAVILLLVAMSFLGRGVGYLSALFSKH